VVTGVELQAGIFMAWRTGRGGEGEELVLVIRGRLHESSLVGRFLLVGSGTEYTAALSGLNRLALVGEDRCGSLLCFLGRRFPMTFSGLELLNWLSSVSLARGIGPPTCGWGLRICQCNK